MTVTELLYERPPHDISRLAEQQAREVADRNARGLDAWERDALGPYSILWRRWPMPLTPMEIEAYNNRGFVA